MNILKRKQQSSDASHRRQRGWEIKKKTQMQPVDWKGTTHKGIHIELKVGSHAGITKQSYHAAK